VRHSKHKFESSHGEVSGTSSTGGHGLNRLFPVLGRSGVSNYKWLEQKELVDGRKGNFIKSGSAGDSIICNVYV
jgi:hypothetical protein